jgi:phycoerythrobilin:ferredoxin oxidoreductase
MSLYQPFLDHAIGQLNDRLELTPYPIPEGFKTKSAEVGKGDRAATVLTESYGVQSEKLRQIRAAHVQGGAALQVLNFVIFPRLNYDLPFFGADLVTLPGGHLIAIDMQPLFHTPEYKARYSDPVMPIFEQYKAVLPRISLDSPNGTRCFRNPRLRRIQRLSRRLFKARRCRRTCNRPEKTRRN